MKFPPLGLFFPSSEVSTGVARPRTPPPPPPPPRMCSKTIYPKKKDAVTMMNARLRGHNAPPQLRPYYCDQCGGWHLTRKELD